MTSPRGRPISFFVSVTSFSTESGSKEYFLSLGYTPMLSQSDFFLMLWFIPVSTV